MNLRVLILWISLFAAPTLGAAQVEVSIFAGAQSANPSDAAIRDPSIGQEDLFLSWEGRSLEAPVYYGLRATSWRSDSFGLGLDFAHNKIYATDDTRPAAYEVLEFTDGLNTLTVNAYRRWTMRSGVSPYVGGGLGIAVPHVEVTNGSSETAGYQLTGPAATWIAGAQMPVTDQWSVFGEYKGTFSSNTADLDSGGTLATDVVTNSVNVGVSFNF